MTSRLNRTVRPFLWLLTVAALPLALGAGPCGGGEEEEPVTADEATEALDEMATAEQALTLASGSVEIATDFTIGEAVERAAEDVRDFVGTQLPCAEVTLEGATLNVEYGALPGNCTWRGQTYEGRHSMTFVSAEPGSLVVDHEWEEFTNGVVSVTGTAHVSWSSAALERRVTHELTWTRLADGRVGVGSGDRTQRALAGGLAEGVRIDGERSWTSGERTWQVEIDGVEARWVDAVPQAGSYWLTNPAGKVLELSFARVDEDTIAVTLSSGGRSFTFDVSRLGTATPR